MKRGFDCLYELIRKFDLHAILIDGQEAVCLQLVPGLSLTS